MSTADPDRRPPPDSPASVFERNSRKTLFAIFVVGFIAFDLLLAQALTLTGVYDPPHKHEARYRMRHPVYHHTLKPLISEYDAFWGPLGFPVTTNSLGFMDKSPREIELRAPGPRLLFMGDSFTEGSGYAYEESFAGRVDARLAPHGIEVLNGGVGSYSPIIYLRKTEHLLEQGLSFDHLIVFIDISDAYNEYKHYRFDAARNVVDRSPPGFGDRLRDWLSDNTVFYAYARIWMRQMKQQRKADKLSDQAGLAINNDRSLWTINQAIYDDWGKTGLETSGEHMDALYRLSRRHGFSLTVAVYPWPDQIWYRDIDSYQVKFWRDWAAKRGVPMIDFFPVFIDGAGDAETVIREYFIDGDVHWNEAGNKLIADGLLDVIGDVLPDMPPIPAPAGQPGRMTPSVH